MKKEQLKKLRALNATKAMMNKARENRPDIVRKPWGNEMVYKYGIYIRVQILSGYLKIAFFLAGFMRLGGNKPVYEVYIDKENGEFITWDCLAEKWRNAKIDMLDWPSYCHYSGIWINSEGYQSIKRHLGTSKGGWAGILEYQCNIRKEDLKERYRRETDPWDIDMEQVPALPKDWEHWVSKTAIDENFIFYDYSRNVTSGWCTYCEKDVPIKNPKHLAEGQCKVCKRKITYQSNGKAKEHLYTESKKAYLMQRCEDGFVVREFRVYRYYDKENRKNTEVASHETRRAIYQDMLPRIYNYSEYKDHSMRWCRAEVGWSSSYKNSYKYYYGFGWADGAVYEKTIPSLAKKELAKTGLPEFIKQMGKADPEEYLDALRYKPYLEQLVKAGLSRLARQICIGDRGVNFKKDVPLDKALSIDKMRLKRLRKNNGGYGFLDWMRYEKAKNTKYPDDCIRYLEKHDISPKTMQFMLQYIPFVKAVHYMQKQEKNIFANKRGMQWMLSEYEDYIKMAKRLKMDVSNSLIYMPKNLIEAHNMVIQLMEENGLSIEAAAVADKFPKVEDVLKEIKDKYSYSDKKFEIRVPEKIEDMLNESKVLSLCMDRDDRYFNRISDRETYIVFLRKKEDVEKPWYVLEIEPGGIVRQESTVGDRKNKDFDEALPFIRKWQREIQKRITEEDKKLAEQSVQLRLKQFEELRKNKNKIWHGPLQGQLLVDVLEERLLEVEENVG